MCEYSYTYICKKELPNVYHLSYFLLYFLLSTDLYANKRTQINGNCSLIF